MCRFGHEKGNMDMEIEMWVMLETKHENWHYQYLEEVSVVSMLKVK